jgi:hypothetical protein
MDKKGYELISEALTDADIDAVIQPNPAEDEDARFISIVPEIGTHGPVQVLNALARAGFMHIENSSYQSPLALRVITVTLADDTHNLFFEDLNAESTDYDH